MLFLSCFLCCSRCSVFICTERIYWSCACLWDVCQADGVYQLNYRATQRHSVLLHLTGNFMLFPAGTAFVPESSIISENISSGLWRATHSVCAGGWQRGGMWVSSLSTQQTVCRSPDLRGIGGEMRRQTPPHMPQHPLILMHKQIRVREKIEGLCMCVGHIDEKSFGYFNFAFSACVCECVSVCACLCERVSSFTLGMQSCNKSC